MTSNFTYKKKQKLTVKLKELVVKYVEGKKLGRKDKQNIVVRSFLGTELNYYKKPSIRQ